MTLTLPDMKWALPTRASLIVVLSQSARLIACSHRCRLFFWNGWDPAGILKNLTPELVRFSQSTTQQVGILSWREILWLTHNSMGWNELSDPDMRTANFEFSCDVYREGVYSNTDPLIKKILPGLMAFMYLGALFSRCEIRTNKYISLQFPIEMNSRGSTTLTPFIPFQTNLQFQLKKRHFGTITWRISCYDFNTIFISWEIWKRMLLNVSITHIQLHIYGFL